MLFVTTCCIYKSTSYIYLFNNCKEKSTFCTRPRVLREYLKKYSLELEFFFPFQTFTSKASFDPNSTSKARMKQSPLDLEYSYFSHFTSNISGQQCMGLKAARAWETCSFGLTKKLPCLDSSFTKVTIELYWDLWKLFYSK